MHNVGAGAWCEWRHVLEFWSFGVL